MYDQTLHGAAETGLSTAVLQKWRVVDRPDGRLDLIRDLESLDPLPEDPDGPLPSLLTQLRSVLNATPSAPDSQP